MMMPIAEMREFAGFAPAEQRYIKRSLDIGLARTDAFRRWGRGEAENVAIRRQYVAYQDLKALRGLIPSEGTPQEVERFLGKLVRIAACDLEQERLALSYQERGLEVVVVRPSAVFGPGDPDGMNTLIWMVKNGRLPFYLGSGQAVVNLVFVRDVVRGTVAAMERGRPGEVYHLVGPNLTQEQLFGLLAQVSGGRSPRWAMPVPVLSSPVSVSALPLSV